MDNPERVIRVTLGDLDSLRPEAVGIFCFTDVRPLTGVAGFVDWRVCGALSRRLESKEFFGKAGEVLLLATTGRLGRQRLFVFGLGPYADCRRESLRQASRRAFEVMNAAGIEKIIFVAPNSPADTEVEKQFFMTVGEEFTERVIMILVGK